MSETFMTVRGRVAHKPELHQKEGRAPMTVFRVGVNPRYFDRGKGEWVDGRTEWYSVMSFGNLARNTAFSVNKGDPVIVYGRFRTSEWQPKEGGPPRLSLEIIASSIGHDLRLGSTNYARTRYDDDEKVSSENPAAKDKSTAGPPPFGADDTNDGESASDSGDGEAAPQAIGTTKTAYGKQTGEGKGDLVGAVR